MKLVSFEISGFRNFHNNMTVSGNDIDGNIVTLVGKNGSGKSTILEVIKWILGNQQIHQMSQGFFSKGVHENTGARFFLKCSITDEEKEDLISRLISNDSFNQQPIMDSITENLSGNEFEIEIEVSRNPDLSRPNRSEFIVKSRVNQQLLKDIPNSDTNYLPLWFTTAKNQQILCAYVGLISGISLNQQSTFNLQNASQIGQMFNQNNEQRHSRNDIGLDSYMNSMATRSVWEKIKETDLSTLSIIEDLDDLNKVIDPLRLGYNEEALENSGNFQWEITNTSIADGKPYQITDISSGERQIIVLWIALKMYQRNILKPLLLFDEPDNSLHSDFIIRIGQLFEKTLSSQDGMCFIATHSTDLIATMPNTVYKIGRDDHKLSKVNNLAKRVELFSELGKTMDMKYLADKVFLVEGATKNLNIDDGLPDHEIYQEIFDPKHEEYCFIPTGRKKDNVATKQACENLAKIINTLNINDIVSIVDRDNDITQNQSVVALPVKNIENLFIQNATELEDSVQKIINDNEFKLSDIDNFSITDPINNDGKALLKTLDTYLESAYASYKNTSRLKDIQRDMIQKSKTDPEAIFGKELNDFFERLK